MLPFHFAAHDLGLWRHHLVVLRIGGEPAISAMVEAIRAERAIHSLETVMVTGYRYSRSSMGSRSRFCNRAQS